MFIGLCSNMTEEEADPISVYDPDFIDPGWGYNQPDDPVCATDEEIMEFLTVNEPFLRMYTN